MRFSSFAGASAAFAFLPAILAQISTKCDPTKQTCPATPGLGTSSYSIDFTTTPSGTQPSGWTLANYEYVTYNTNGRKNGAELSFLKKGDSPTMWSNWYFLFGRVDVVAQAAPGSGIVSSIVLFSDDFDEIDWEWRGSYDTIVQTNYFGKAITGSYNHSTSPTVSSPMTAFHTYSIDWSPTAITWLFDGQVVRTLKASDCQGTNNQYPQSPMKISLGLWDAGDPDNYNSWGGGKTPIPPPAGGYSLYVKSVKVTNANPADLYTWTDKSGTWGSIKGSNTTKPSTSSSNVPTQSVKPVIPTSPMATLSIVPSTSQPITPTTVAGVNAGPASSAAGVAPVASSAKGAAPVATSSAAANAGPATSGPNHISQAPSDKPGASVGGSTAVIAPSSAPVATLTTQQAGSITGKVTLEEYLAFIRNILSKYFGSSDDRLYGRTAPKEDCDSSSLAIASSHPPASSPQNTHPASLPPVSHPASSPQTAHSDQHPSIPYTQVATQDEYPTDKLASSNHSSGDSSAHYRPDDAVCINAKSASVNAESTCINAQSACVFMHILNNGHFGKHLGVYNFSHVASCLGTNCFWFTTYVIAEVPYVFLHSLNDDNIRHQLCDYGLHACPSNDSASANGSIVALHSLNDDRVRDHLYEHDLRSYPASDTAKVHANVDSVDCHDPGYLEQCLSKSVATAHPPVATPPVVTPKPSIPNIGSTNMFMTFTNYHTEIETSPCPYTSGGKTLTSQSVVTKISSSATFTARIVMTTEQSTHVTSQLTTQVASGKTTVNTQAITSIETATHSGVLLTVTDYTTKTISTACQTHTAITSRTTSTSVETLYSTSTSPISTHTTVSAIPTASIIPTAPAAVSPVPLKTVSDFTTKTLSTSTSTLSLDSASKQIITHIPITAIVPASVTEWTTQTLTTLVPNPLASHSHGAPASTPSVITTISPVSYTSTEWTTTIISHPATTSIDSAGSTITAPASAITQAIQVAPAGANAVSAYSTATGVSTVTSVGRTIMTTFTSTMYTTLSSAAAAPTAVCAGGSMGASGTMSRGVCAPTGNITLGNVAAASAVPSAFTGNAAGLLVRKFAGLAGLVGGVLGVAVLL
ncbi:MAG: hypothetical protein OHK93_005280 [Ramalina farinacea]|uniref:GH16 domain-containing protein n=1 Tax=Ramalina farinacea TaxID=258253 RepID=A0AA43R072_9LECA|nr:hypothetical protein [Ramalina farinacea]